MELSRRDFMRSTAAFTAVASVLGTSGIAFAQDADQNCLVSSMVFSPFLSRKNEYSL